MDPVTIAAIAQAGAGIIQGIQGFGQTAAAKRIARSNPRPTYTIPKAVMDNQAIAESRASKGLSEQSIDLYKQDSDRKTTSSIDAILKGGGNVNNISDLYTATNNGVSKMALIDDEMRSRNIKTLQDQNTTMGDYQDKAWQLNFYDPYVDKAQAAAALQKQGNDNKWKAVNTVVSAGANYAIGKQYAKEGKQVFGDKTNMDASSSDPTPYQSKMLKPQPTAGQIVSNKYPGLAGFGRRGGIASLYPVWSQEQNAYIDPLTGQIVE